MLFEQKINKLKTNYANNQSNPFDIYDNSRTFTFKIIIAVKLLIIAVKRTQTHLLIYL